MNANHQQKSPARKALHVATLFTGVTACAAVYAPAMANAQTATTPAPGLAPPPGDHVMHAGGTSPDIATASNHEPYTLNVYMAASVYSFQVCGWHTNNQFSCTPNFSDPYPTAHTFNVGGGWNRGKINVWWNGHGRGSFDTCNTNPGGFNGFSNSNGTNVILTGANSAPIGFGQPVC
jgi:hypothetical protein